MMRVLIAGYGFVGASLGERLSRRGDEVYGLRRTELPSENGIHMIAADLLDRASLGSLPEVDALVFAPSPGARKPEAYSAIYGDAFANLIEAFGDAPPRRVVFVSSTSVYGQDDDSDIDESSPIDPRTETARALAAAEERAQKRVPELALLRLSGIYGPGRTHLIRTVINGELPARDPFTNRIHRDDAAQAIERILDASRPAPLYLGVDDAPARLSEVRAFIASELRRLGHPPAEAEIPSKTRSMSGSKRILNGALREIGFRPKYPSYREGYPEIIAAYLETIAR